MFALTALSSLFPFTNSIVRTKTPDPFCIRNREQQEQYSPLLNHQSSEQFPIVQVIPVLETILRKDVK